MNSIWNDPDCVVRAGRVLEAVLPCLIELHTVFFQELGVKGRHHSPHHEHLGTLKCESCVNKMFDQE